MKKYLYLLIGVLFLSSCEDFLTVESDTGVTDLNYWKSASDLDAANDGLYQTFRWYMGQTFTTQYRDRGLPFDVMGLWANPSNNDL